MRPASTTTSASASGEPVPSKIRPPWNRIRAMVGILPFVHDQRTPARIEQPASMAKMQCCG
jgi:hypothetical protein